MNRGDNLRRIVICRALVLCPIVDEENKTQIMELYQKGVLKPIDARK